MSQSSASSVWVMGSTLSALPDSPSTLLQTPALVSSGPTHWKELAPACGGPAQSPINIDLRLVQRDYTLEPFVFQGYDTAPLDPWTLENNGHTGQHHKVKTNTQRQEVHTAYRKLIHTQGSGHTKLRKQLPQRAHCSHPHPHIHKWTKKL